MAGATLQSRVPVGHHLGPRGLTLTELLVAAALSLVVMGALAGLFGLFGRAIKRSESTMNLGSLMRSAAWQLRQDLAGVTCPLTPWLSPETGAGFFELIEGPERDTTYALDGQGLPTTCLTADTDDILVFTTQSLGGAFVGRYDGQTIESPYAEVAWFCRPAATQSAAGTTLYDLHRRQLLVMNYLGRDSLVNNALPLSTDRAACDISLRSDTIAGQGQVLLPNALGDLTRREFRFMRGGYSFVTESGATRSVAAQVFPFAFPVDSTQHAVAEAALDGTRRASEDVILTNVVGFDVRVFDPQAAVSSGGRVPGDPGYAAPQAGDAVGAYVDLGWGGGTAGLRTDPFPPAGKTAFQSAGVAVTDSPRRVSLPSPTYDTWSRHYEFNGIDDDGDGTIDEAAHGVDGTDADPYPEDTVDVETSPPYPVLLRGLEVRIRCYEPSSQQVRQVTIRHCFVR
jgi:type II secretory pathway pseudopilin PulG